ncbi:MULTISPECIES: 4-(cytidine 5'-diphospho)-2-C-methyl-D-erythritol kinase [Planktothricoides]|uniref:4-diphosphocytidyl-2-C-methyl-D-erythritol kinase n=2 Tax=Planktothricoides raciborskii TaxID=132608 RepID=A0AAU8JGI4_9CYAN|nr:MULTISPECIES: 4-(cytidine 5'-diphospho)-2-C-methyl-D-erythritol kinase [Planktothricoides]KOR37009.1 4-diphosphocytidyl-2C-methyl-D-erythritol kinase [Planktothricoides sp. SR001]MBD2545275.1 4-(cytidine 5'-diphospho)-2-C-methyl-D-erythritol kinase [Planktothricoides raciborskii FACHB-1370]MBD2584409.1 4-(cytidine 5'-diphospho)-2-C-methyl-D-erythritol kinase [Planktothricoides raciborskii FACHB-1261]
MRSYSLIAPAKINLYLEIIGNAPGGYHELAMVLQSISLADRVHLRANGTQQFHCACNSNQVPQDKTNLAYRAAELMAKQFPQAFNRYGAVDINIEKQIPVAAGLAGGSSNAAAVLVGLNLIWQLGLTQPELQELAAQLGSDIPFCISGGTALATGRGEMLEPLPDLPPISVILAKYRSLEISTAWAYGTYRQKFGHTYVSEPEALLERRQRFHSGSMIAAIAHQDGQKIGQLLHNDLEKVALPAYPQVAQLRSAFENTDILGVMMSGSGPTVFALAESPEKAQQASITVKNTLNHPDLDFWVAQLIPCGIQIDH